MAENSERRPDKATRNYVVDLLLDHVLVPGTPQQVAASILNLVTARGVITEKSRHFGLPNDLDAFLSFPSDAARALRRAVLDATERCEGLELLDHLIRGPGITGSGAGGGGAISITTQDETARADLAAADRLTWDRDRLVRRLGGSNKDARIIVDHIISTLQRGSEKADGKTGDTGEAHSGTTDLAVELDRASKLLRWKNRSIPLRSRKRVDLLAHLAEADVEWSSGPNLARLLDLQPYKMIRRLRDDLGKLDDELGALIESGKEGYRVNPRFRLRVAEASEIDSSS